MKKTEKVRQKTSIKQKIATNLTLGLLVLSVGALCIAPQGEEATSVVAEEALYRSAGKNGKGVSLMINVYEGTEIVYQMLDVFKARGGKATFFIGGCWADDNVQCVKDIASAGHEIGNHGYFHRDHKKLSASQNEKEIADCNRFIKLAIGSAPTLFAPPSGSYGEETLSVCKMLDLKAILWSKDTIDWRDRNSALIYTRATENVVRGDFILMHPTKETVAALDDILKYYEKNALQTVTVSQNLGVKEGL